MRISSVAVVIAAGLVLAGCFQPSLHDLRRLAVKEWPDKSDAGLRRMFAVGIAGRFMFSEVESVEIGGHGWNWLGNYRSCFRVRHKPRFEGGDVRDSYIHAVYIGLGSDMNLRDETRHLFSLCRGDTYTPSKDYDEVKAMLKAQADRLDAERRKNLEALKRGSVDPAPR